MHTSRLPFWFFFAALMLVSSGCTASRILAQSDIKKPKAEIIDYRISYADHRDIVGIIEVKVTNPNTFGIKDTLISYRLDTEHANLFLGNNAQVNIAPEATSIIKLPIRMRYKELAHAVPDLSAALVYRRDYIPAKLWVRLDYSPVIYNEHESGKAYFLPKEMRQRVKIPLPEEKVDRAKKKLKEKLKKLF